MLIDVLMFCSLSFCASACALLWRDAPTACTLLLFPLRGDLAFASANIMHDRFSVQDAFGLSLFSAICISNACITPLFVFQVECWLSLVRGRGRTFEDQPLG